MKIQLTEEKLMVNKWECRSVTIYKLEDGTFEATMFDVKGITKRKPVMSNLSGKQKINWDGTGVFKNLNLKKKIKSKSFIYMGIQLIGSEWIKYASNKNGSYLNYYNKKKKDVKRGKSE